MTVMVDSNIWAYYFDATMPEHKLVVTLLDEFLVKKEVVITTVVAIETIHYLFKRLARKKARELAKLFIQGDFKIIALEENILDSIIEKLSQTIGFGIGGRDASILVAMDMEGISRIMTHDQAFKKVTGLEVIDPITK